MAKGMIPVTEKPVAASAALSDFFLVCINGMLQRATVETIADALTAAQLEVVKNAIQKAEATITSAEDTIVRVETERNQLNEVFAAANEAKQAAVEAKNHADRAKPKVLVVTCNTNASFTTIEASTATYAQMDSFVRAGGCVLLLCRYGEDIYVLTSASITKAEGISFVGSTGTLRLSASISSGGVWAVSSQQFAGDAGGYYTMTMTQPSPDIIRVVYEASKPDMPKVPPVDISLPKGNDGVGIASITYSPISNTWKFTYTDGTSNDIQGPTVPSKLSDLNEDKAHRTVSDTEKAAWNGKSDFPGTWTALSEKPDNFPPAAHNQPASTIQSGTFDGQVNAKQGWQSPGAYLLRNCKLSATDETPTANGEICWHYK